MDKEIKKPVQPGPDVDDAVDSHESSIEHEHTESLGCETTYAGVSDRVTESEKLPEAIGPYRILGKLGEGGIGIVYEAEQQHPRRLVALKVMRGGPFIGEDQARMLQREAETLARLKHPSIGSIYEAGRTEEGQHFFAMELVRGNTLADWLAARPDQIDTDELRLRLRVFRKIADAVHYAHQRGVIHRDLKPANIIVSDEVSASGTSGSLSPLPEVKVLDFGLARITDQDVAAATLVTEIGVIKGTLPYMSPEQARGNPDEIDLRTDVYALGIILYEMLSGRRPYNVARSALAEAIRVICDEQPRPLRETWSGVHRLNQDVETIVGTALEKEPDRRYSSAASLAEDVTRYLDSQPILARPPSAGYQIKMMVARHRISFVALVVILLVVVGASVVSTVQYLRAEREARRALIEAEKSDQVAGFLSSMLEGAGPAVARGRDATILKEILDETSKRVSRELADQPEVEAAIRSTLGVTYLELGDFEKAEIYLLESLEMYRDLEQESADVAQCLHNIGVWHTRAGRYEDSERSYREALKMRRVLFGDSHKETVDSLTGLGNVLVSMERYEEAEVHLRGALALKRTLYESPDPAIALGINSLANLLHHGAEYDEAEKLYREALVMHRETLGEDHPDVMIDLSNLASLMRDRGELDDAEQIFREVVETNRRLYGDSHPMVATSLSNIGGVLLDRRAYDDAEAAFREALEMQRETLDEQNPDIANTLNSIGLTYGERGDNVTARDYYQQALAMHRLTLGEEHSSVVTDLNNIGYSFMTEKRFDEAETVFQEALDLSLRVLGELDETTLLLKNNIARLVKKRKDYEGAEELFRQVLEGRLELLGDAHPSVAVTLFDLGQITEIQGKDQEAEEFFKASLESYRSSYGPDHAATVFSEIRVARFLHARGDYDEAEPLLRHASEALLNIYGPNTKHSASGRVLLARTLAAKGGEGEKEAEEIYLEALDDGVDTIGAGMFARAQLYRGELLAKNGKFPEAELLFLAGHAYFDEAGGPDHPETQEAVGRLAHLYESWQASDPEANKEDKARSWRARQH